MSNRTGVIIVGGIVINHIVWSDDTEAQLSKDGYTTFEETTNMDPKPGLFWTWTDTDGYRPPKLFPSWIWSNNQWIPPVEMPNDGKFYQWDESLMAWVLRPTSDL